MHKKFRNKILIDELLNLMEETAKDIENLRRSASLLNDYCKLYKNIPEINNMLHLTNSFEISLLCLFKEIDNIIQKAKYNKPDFMDNLGKNFDTNDIIFDD